MARRFPLLLRRPENLVAVPAVRDAPPGQRPRFVHGDPRPWIPAATAVWAARGAELLPWTGDGDVLVAPLAREEREREALQDLLSAAPAGLTVLLYERDEPLWPNLLLHDAAADAEDPADASAGLRAYRSMFRHRGRGSAEAFLALPAWRVRALLAGRRRAARRPVPDDLENRRFLQTALDHHRSLAERRRRGGLAELGDARRIAVVSPHYDDESLAFAGAVLRARARGAEVRVIWLTDGARGMAGAAPEEAVRVRREEAEACMQTLGVEDHHHLGAPETRLQRRGPWTGALRRLLEEFAPDCVHLPWWGDNSVDHYEANRLLRAAWPRGHDALVAAGGIWTPVPASALLRLTKEERVRKEDAIRCHRSQLRAVDYLRAERGLARWHAGTEGGHAEAYWALPAGDYFAAFRDSGAARRLFRG